MSGLPATAAVLDFSNNTQFLEHYKSNSISIGVTIPRYPALSMNILLIFYLYDLNGELFLNISFFFLLLASLVPITAVLLQKYMHHYSHTNLILA